MKPHASGKFGTGTATLAIFDPLCLAKRVEDDCDWWADPDEEVTEINAGNVMFAGLGCDGGYEFDVYRLKPGEVMPEVAVKSRIRTIMGSFYVGAGEEVVGEDIGPSTQYGGMMFSIPAGSYLLGLSLNEDTGMISIYFEPSDEEARNAFTASPRICA